jgi:hypothetical protein
MIASIAMRSVHQWLLCWLWVSAGISVGMAQDPEAAEKPPAPSRDLLEGLPITQTGDELISSWKTRRLAIQGALQEVMGPLPVRRHKVPSIQVMEEVDAGSYIRRLITFQTEPDTRTPAYLCLPKRVLVPGMQAPAALCLHPTDNRVGHQVVVGLGGRPGRAYAHELAERGWITLSPAYPLLAQYQPDLQKLGYASGSMKAIHDNQCGLDFLESLPWVKPGGFAAIGHSLGGHNAIFTAVMDERIQVVVTSCGFDRFVDYMQGDLTGWTGPRYMPRLLDHAMDSLPFDFDQLIACLAPRSIFISAPLWDENFRNESVRQIIRSVQPIYQLLDHPKGLMAVYPAVGHDFPEATRIEAYRFMEHEIQGVLLP